MVDAANLSSVFEGIELAARLGKTHVVIELSEIGRSLLWGSDVEVLNALTRGAALIKELNHA